MRKATGLMLACAAAASFSFMTSVSHGAAVFTENFTSGDVTDGGLWSTAAVTNPSNVTFSEPVNGPLTIGISTAAQGTLEGGYIQSTSLDTFNFLNGPMLETLTAPVVNGVQTSLTPTTDSAHFNSAFTLLGVDSGPGARLDTGNNRVYVGLNGGNNLEFTMPFYDSTAGKNTAVNYGIYNSSVPSGPNIDITSIWLYLDGSQPGNMWIDFGATWLNTSTNTPGSIDWSSGYQHYPLNPYSDPATGHAALNITSRGPWYSSWSAQQIQDIKNGYPNGAAGAAEVVNATNNAVAGESVSFGQLSVVVPEPTSLALVAAGAGLLLRRKRHQA